VVAVLGSLYVRATGDDTILLVLIVMIGGLVVLGMLNADMVPSYPLGVFAISLSLLLFTSLSTTYLLGQDVHVEYYVFKLADSALRWSPNLASTNLIVLDYNAMLSITILPTVVCSVLNLDGLLMFKLVYPIIISLIPLALFEVYRNVLADRKVAFLSTFFFVSQTAFQDLIGLIRQGVGELFLVLVVLVLLDNEFDQRKRSALILIFSEALIFSHYSMAYFYLLLLCIWMLLVPRISRDQHLTQGIFLLICITIIGSYIFILSLSPIVTLVGRVQVMANAIVSDLFSSEARGGALTGLGLIGPAQSTLHEIWRILNYGSEFFILVGLVDFLARRNKSSLSTQYLPMVVFGGLLILLAVGVPHFAESLNIWRTYGIALLFLSPLCVLGGKRVLDTLEGFCGFNGRK
jgi:uncharacterized membrane protein